MSDDLGGFPLPNTPEWGVMNNRRWHLIQKDHREGLDDAERAELQDLQAKSLAAVEAMCHGTQNTTSGAGG